MAKLNTVRGTRVDKNRFYVIKGSNLHNLAKNSGVKDTFSHVLDRRYKSPNIAHQTAVNSIDAFNNTKNGQNSASNALNAGDNVLKIHSMQSDSNLHDKEDNSDQIEKNNSSEE